MSAWLLVVVPLVGAILAHYWPSERTRPWLLPATGLIHCALVLGVFVRPPEDAPGAWLGFDPVARAVLPVVSLLFLACAVYAVAYLRLREQRSGGRFVPALLASLALLSAGLQARHLWVLWFSIEALTLVTVPLLRLNRTPRTKESTKNYLVIGGTGAALSLLGSLCLSCASPHGGALGSLTFAFLTGHAGSLSGTWVLIAWILILVGYGTKMGLVPMHIWKAETYSDAPGVVAAWLAGGVAPLAFTAVLRVRAVVAATGQGASANLTLLTIGFGSLGVAALLLVGVRDFRRMLAYASIAQMGTLAVGAGLGSAGAEAALFHLWSNTLSLGALILGASTLRRAAASRRTDRVAGMFLVAPRSAALFVAGALAVAAFPPFAPFFSELAVFRAALAAGNGIAAGCFLVCVLFAFLGLTRLTFSLVDGRPPPAAGAGKFRLRESLGLVAPPLALLGLSLWLGSATPAPLRGAWTAAVQQLYPHPLSLHPAYPHLLYIRRPPPLR